jgi:hypothetical protein
MRLTSTILTLAAVTALALSARAEDPAPIQLRAELWRTNAAGTKFTTLRQGRAFDVVVTLLDAPTEGIVLHSERLRVVPLSGAMPSDPASGQVNLPGRLTGPLDLVLGGTPVAPLPPGLLGTEVWYTTQVIVPKGKGEKAYGVSPPKLVPARSLADDLLRHLRVVELPVDDFGRTATAIRFEGVNVQIVNGLGATNGDPVDPLGDSKAADVNGLGNLIVGYNELRSSPELNDRSGSHTLVVGQQHNFSTFGGLLAGVDNTITGIYAAVSGGWGNRASGQGSAVNGGWENLASGHCAAVGGGRENTASGAYASVGGGYGNKATATDSSVNGGSLNIASGLRASVNGGLENLASGENASAGGGYFNEATGLNSAVSGGKQNLASGDNASVSGGHHNEAINNQASASGGAYNVANGWSSSVTGGLENIAIGSFTSVTGGKDNTANQHYSAVNGGRHNYAASEYSTVGGGWTRTAWGVDDWVAGLLWTDG